MARKLLEPQGRWQALLADLTRLMEKRERANTASSSGEK